MNQERTYHSSVISLTSEATEAYDHYRMALRKLSAECEFGTITPNEILRARLVFGIRDAKVRERLLRESNLTLQKTDEICRAAESTSQQLKLLEPQEVAVHSVRKTTKEDRRNAKECWMCGRKYSFRTKESCPAFGKTCNKCHKPNHVAVKCCQKSQLASIRQVEDQESEDEVYHTSALAHDPDDSQLITLERKLHVVSGRHRSSDSSRCIQKSRKRPVPQKDHENHSQDCSIWWFNSSRGREKLY